MTSPLTNLLAAARDTERAMSALQTQVARVAHLKYDYITGTMLASIDAALTPLRKAIAEGEKLQEFAPDLIQTGEEFNRSTWAMLNCLRGGTIRVSDSDQSEEARRLRDFCAKSDLHRDAIARAGGPPANCAASVLAPTPVTPAADCNCGMCTASRELGACTCAHGHPMCPTCVAAGFKSDHATEPVLEPIVASQPTVNLDDPFARAGLASATGRVVTNADGGR